MHLKVITFLSLLLPALIVVGLITFWVATISIFVVVVTFFVISRHRDKRNVELSDRYSSYVELYSNTLRQEFTISMSSNVLPESEDGISLESTHAFPRSLVQSLPCEDLRSTHSLPTSLAEGEGKYPSALLWSHSRPASQAWS